MALPVIIIDVNAVGASDTAASGAGPSTALTGTAASFATDVITLDGSPSLADVAVDGSHVIYLLTSTGVRYFKITAKDDSAKTVTVTPNPAGTDTGLTWAIGGRRLSLNDASTKRLLDDGTTGDAMPGWIVQFASGHTETTTSQIRIRRNGDTTDGPITLQGEPGAATMPIITANFNGVMFTSGAGNGHQFKYFEVRNSNATKTASMFLQSGSGGLHALIEGMIIGHATNNFWKGINAATTGYWKLKGSIIHHCASNAFEGTGGGYVIENSRIESNGAGCVFSGIGVMCNVHDSLIINNTGIGISEASGGGGPNGSCRIVGNVIFGNGSDGIRITPADVRTWSALVIKNNIIGDNAIGINATTADDEVKNFYGATVDANAFGFPANTTGQMAGITNGPNDITLTADPFVNAAAGDFNINDTANGGAVLRAATVVLP